MDSLSTVALRLPFYVRLCVQACTRQLSLCVRCSSVGMTALKIAPVVAKVRFFIDTYESAVRESEGPAHDCSEVCSSE